MVKIEAYNLYLSQDDQERKKKSTISYTCSVVTPMVVSGADQMDVALRETALKASLRFWWRALQPEKEIETLRQKEFAIFGGSSGDEPQKSKLRISIVSPTVSISEEACLLPHKKQKNMQALHKAYLPKAEFEVTFFISGSESNPVDVEKLTILLMLSSILGGLGRRSRRGFGAYTVEKIYINGELLPPPPANTIEKIQDLLKKMYEKWSWEECPYKITKDGKAIMLEGSGHTATQAQYPFIRKIEIGTTSYSDHLQLLTQIGAASHSYNGIRKTKQLGYANDSRLASPVYVSAIVKDKAKDGVLFPIITTLAYLTQVDQFIACILDGAKECQLADDIEPPWLEDRDKGRCCNRAQKPRR